MVIGKVSRSQSMWTLSTRIRRNSSDTWSPTGSVSSSSTWSLSMMGDSPPGNSVIPPSGSGRRIFKKRENKKSAKMAARRMTIGPCICGDVTASDGQGKTLLFYAARYGQAEPARQLIEAGSDPNSTDHLGYTALHEAVDKGQLEIAEILLRDGHADVDVAGTDGETPLLIAASRGQIDFVKLLYKHGADINMCDGEGNPPIYRALDRGWVEVAEYLLDRQCDVNISSSNEKTCFSAAFKSPVVRTENMARRLIKLGYDFTKDAEWLQTEGCPISIKDEPRLHDKVMSRAGLLTRKNGVSIIGNGTRKFIKSLRKSFSN